MGFEVLVTLEGRTFRGVAQESVREKLNSEINSCIFWTSKKNKKAAKADAARDALMANPHLLKTPETLTLENGRSPVAELNELTNALAKWKIAERNDDGMIKGKFQKVFFFV